MSTDLPVISRPTSPEFPSIVRSRASSSCPPLAAPLLPQVNQTLQKQKGKLASSCPQLPKAETKGQRILRREQEEEKFLARQLQHSGLQTRRQRSIVQREYLQRSRDADDIEFLGAKGKDGFRTFLQKKFGSILKGWRAIDSDNSGRLGFHEFCHACRVVCLSRPPGPPGPTSEVPDTLRRDFELAPSGCEYFDDTFQLPGHVESTPESLPAEGHMSGDFRVCPDAYWAAFHQRAWPNARRRFEGEKVFAPSKVIVGPKAGPRLVFSRRAHPRRPPGRQERRPGSRPTSRSFGASKAGAGAIRPSKEEPAANAGSLECRAAKTPCYEVTEEEFERLWLSGAVAPPIALGEVEDVYEIPEEDFDRLLKAGQLQLAKEDDFEVTRRTVKRPRQHPEEVLVSTLPAPVAKPMPPSTAPTPGRRYTEPMTARPRSLAESKKAFTTFPLSLERSLWSEAMLPRAVGSPARLLRGLRASISGSVVPLTETEAVTRSTAASSSKVDDTPVRRMTAGRLPRMPWEMQAMRKTSYSSGTDAGDSERSSPVQALRTLTPLDAPFPSHEDCG